MAEDATDRLSYFLKMERVHLQDLAPIRHWSNLKVGFGEGWIWMTGFDEVQIESAEVKSIPFKSLFYSRGDKLFPLGSRLPDCNPPNVLWTPIERAIPLKVDAWNHNYFGVEERISMQLVPSEISREAAVMYTTLEKLGSYLEAAPAIRLKNIGYVVLNGTFALIFGKPLLPITGEVLWLKGDLVLPTGYDFDLPILSEAFVQQLNPEGACWIVCQPEGTFFKIGKEAVMPLNLSSFRKTIAALNPTNTA